MPAQKKSAAKKPAPSTKPLWQKLFIKGGTVLLMNAPSGYDRVLAGSPAKVVTRGPAAADTVLVFASDQARLEASMPRGRRCGSRSYSGRIEAYNDWADLNGETAGYCEHLSSRGAA